MFARVQADLARKMVFLTGPRQVGKTTLSQALIAHSGGQYLNYDVAQDRAAILGQRWSPRAPLLVLDELHKMPNWKAWLKGVVDGKPKEQQLLVTGSARMDTFRQGGESLAGRFYALRMHPIAVPEWQLHAKITRDAAMAHVLQRSGFPEPCTAQNDIDAQRWRMPYFDGLVRDDVLEYSRIHDIKAIRLFAELLRERVGSPLSLASIARDLAIAPATLKSYLAILEALYVVFLVRPFGKNIARATLQMPKAYFFDVGLVRGNNAQAEGARFENLIACALLRHTQWQRDTLGLDANLHYVRTKDDAEIDFCVTLDGELTHLVECELADPKPSLAMRRFAEQFSSTKATQVVRDLRSLQVFGGIEAVPATDYLVGLHAQSGSARTIGVRPKI